MLLAAWHNSAMMGHLVPEISYTDGVLFKEDRKTTGGLTGRQWAPYARTVHTDVSHMHVVNPQHHYQL